MTAEKVGILVGSCQS